MGWWGPQTRPAIRLARNAGLASGAAALVLVGFYFLVPLLGRTFVRSVELLVAAVVWVATSIGIGVSLWDVLGTIGRAAAGGLATPTASVLLTAVVLVGIVALYWLQRLLDSERLPGSEEESSQ